VAGVPPVTFNPNWPLIDVAVAFGNGPADPAAAHWCSLVDRTMGQVTTNRGRQYELDQVQTGVETLTLQNTDGYLDPANPGSPFAGYVLPYRQFWHLAQWPPTVNLLTADFATAWYASKGASGVSPVPAVTNLCVNGSFEHDTAGSAPAGWSVSGMTAVVTNSTSQFGAQSAKVTGTGAGSPAFQTTVQQPVTAGATYTATAWLNIPAALSNPVYPVAINWYNSGGVFLSSSTAASWGFAVPWGYFSVTAAAPAGAVYATVWTGNSSSLTTGDTYYVDGVILTAGNGIRYFDGDGVPSSSTPVPGYNYAWHGTPGNSLSTQTWVGAGTYPTGMLYQQQPPVIRNGGGYNYYQVPVYAGAGSAPILDVTNWSVTPGGTFTGQAQVSYTGRAGVSARLGIAWYTASGAPGPTTYGPTVALTGAGQTLTVTAGAGTIYAGASLQVWTTAAPASDTNINVWNLQVERNTTASAYVQPGTWYPIFGGLVERWPQQWTNSGMFGVSQLTCVDPFAYLSQRKLLSAVYMELLALGASFLYPLDEPSGSTAFQDLTGNLPPLPTVLMYGASASSCTAGNQLQSTQTGVAAPLGRGGPVVTFNNSDGVTPGAAVLSLAAIRTPPGPPPSGAWTRVIAFRVGAWNSHGSSSYLWFALSPDDREAFEVSVYNDGSMYVSWDHLGTGNGFQFAAAGAVTLGGWHMVTVTMSADGKTVSAYLDNGYVNYASQTFSTDQHPALPAGSYDALGGDVATGTPFNGFQGDMGLVCELPVALTAGQVNRLWGVMQPGISGAAARGGGLVTTSAQRYRDVLTWAGWVGASAVDDYTTGSPVAYGPATELTATAAGSGTAAVTAMQQVVDTDNGAHYADASGVVTFKARRARYNQTVPVVVFGEHTAAGEVPYVDAKTGFDPTRVANDVTVIQTQTSAPTRATSTASAALYGDVQLQRTANCTDPMERLDAAQFLLQHYQQPVQRIDGITVDVAANPSVWPAMLGLELGTRVRVMRRPPGAAPVQVDGFVEQINWSMDDQGRASCALQISVAANMNYWELPGLWATLNAAATFGVSTLVINPLPDAATNPVQANLSVGRAGAGGSWFVLDYGTPQAELVQLASVTPTGVGYTSATLTVNNCLRLDVGGTPTLSTLNFTHPAGAVLQDMGALSPSAFAVPQLLTQIGPWTGAQLDGFAAVGTTTIAGY
jgi:hypothetical protein